MEINESKKIEEIDIDKYFSSPNPKTNLSNKYAFWFQISHEAINNYLKETNKNNIKYESQIKKLSEFNTFEDFWSIYQHIKQPDKYNQDVEYFLFKNSIKPMKEDDSNKNGGKLILKCNKGYTSIIWEEIILNLLGDNFPKDIFDKINGIIFCSKKSFNIIEIWFKEYDKKYFTELEENIRKLIEIPKEVPIYYKKICDEENKSNNGNKDYDYRYGKKYENNKYYNYGYRKYSGHHDNNNYYYHYNKNKKYYY